VALGIRGSCRLWLMLCVPMQVLTWHLHKLLVSWGWRWGLTWSGDCSGRWEGKLPVEDGLDATRRMSRVSGVGGSRRRSLPNNDVTMLRCARICGLGVLFSRSTPAVERRQVETGRGANKHVQNLPVWADSGPATTRCGQETLDGGFDIGSASVDGGRYPRHILGPCAMAPGGRLCWQCDERGGVGSRGTTQGTWRTPDQQQHTDGSGSSFLLAGMG
jgi:hypothetical protein